MRSVTAWLLATLSAFGIARAATDASPLKLAFQEARATSNIDVVLPVFRKARLFVVSGSQRAPGSGTDYFLLPSPKRDGRMCITVAERVESLAKVKWPKVEVSGEELLRTLPPGIEITVVYPDGGDYITREHLEWYRGMLK